MGLEKILSKIPGLRINIDYLDLDHSARIDPPFTSERVSAVTDAPYFVDYAEYMEAEENFDGIEQIRVDA